MLGGLSTLGQAHYSGVRDARRRPQPAQASARHSAHAARGAWLIEISWLVIGLNIGAFWAYYVGLSSPQGPWGH